MRKKRCLLFALICLAAGAKAQQAWPVQAWLKKLSDKSSHQVQAARTVEEEVEKLDSANMINALQQLEAASAGKNQRTIIRTKAIKARTLFYNLVDGDSIYAAMMEEALKNAYELDDDYMIAEYHRWYGEMLNSLNKKAMAAQYCMNALKLQQELGFEHFFDVQRFYFTTAELLYRTRNYKESVNYYREAFQLPAEPVTDSQSFKTNYANSLNTLGMGFNKTGKYDSSVYYYTRCMEYVLKNHVSEDWYYTANYNRYDPYLELKEYDSCRKIASSLYAEGMAVKDSQSLVGACYMFARIAARHDSIDQALKWSLQSEQYGKSLGSLLPIVYHDIAFCYEKLGQMDKAYPYYKKEKQALEASYKSTEKATAAFLEAESEYQRSLLQNKKLQQQKKTQARTRNLLIAGLIFFSAISLFVLNRRRLRMEKARQEAERKSHYFETKYKSAEEQLSSFRQQAEEMGQQLEQLQTELDKRAGGIDDIARIDALSRQMILTEADWNNFRQNFEAVHPVFFTTLRTRFADITQAEMRMAALIRLNFDNKHIASMLGISPDSVHKTRYRLRKRFNGENDSSLEEFIAGI